MEKKSINFPIVNGTLSETEADTSSRPTAVVSGFRSAFARDTSFLNDEEL